jgi:Protein of unknown function (DUF2442)
MSVVVKDADVPTKADWMGKVTSVTVTGPLSLFVRFADGLEGPVRFEETGLNGVFECLRDPEYFAQVGVLRGAVSWPNEIPDLAPDNMHRHLRLAGQWVLQ